MQKNIKIKQLAISSLCIALAMVLSNIKLYSFPFGGSVTAFSMLFASLPGLLYGLPIGLLSAFVYGIIQFFAGAYILSPIQVVVDYGFSFTALGLSGLLYKRNMNYAFILAVVGRYIFGVISGYVFFSEYAWESWHPLMYSICYNGAYMFAEAVLTLILINIPLVKAVFQKLKLES